MKKFWAFVKKEFRHILRDRRTLLILLGMPVAQVIIFGYAVTNEFRNVSGCHQRGQVFELFVTEFPSSKFRKFGDGLVVEPFPEAP